MAARKTHWSAVLCIYAHADHFGVVKGFLDAGLMPRVISGTSAGGVVAAMVCTRTEAELKRMLTPELARRITAFEEPFNIWVKRFRTTGARFDAIQWAKKVGTDPHLHHRIRQPSSRLTTTQALLLHARLHDLPRGVQPHRADLEHLSGPR